MIEAVKPLAARRLRVAISVQDAALAAELRALLLQAGHEVVDAAAPADIVMSDASAGFAAASEPDALLTPRELEVLGAIGTARAYVLRDLGIRTQRTRSQHATAFHLRRDDFSRPGIAPSHRHH